MMDIKSIMTALLMIGLIHCAAFADQRVKHRHHHLHQHKTIAVYDHKNDRHDKVDTNYKDMAPVVAPLCSIGQSTLILNDIHQNRGRAMPNRCDIAWFKRIHLNGGLAIDWLKFGNPSASFTGVNYQRLSLNDAYLNIGVDVNRWTQAFASISYDTATINLPLIDSVTLATANEYSTPYSNNLVDYSVTLVNYNLLHLFQLEQAYATFGNLDELPVFVQIGRQFQDFGRYTIHPITRTLTQSLSEVLATSVQLGFIFPNGLNGSVAMFHDPIQKADHANSKNKTTNYNVALGYNRVDDQLGLNVGAAWMNNMIAANDVAYHVQQFNFINGITGYSTAVSGIALYGDVNSGPFRVSAHYMSALKRWDFNDLPRYAFPSLFYITNFQGAKPWAMDLQLGYAFDGITMHAAQNIYVGYQTSRDTSSLGLPKSRWVLGYNVTPFKNAAFALEWDRDHDYSPFQGGTGRSYNLVTLRSTVKFG